MTDTTEAGRVPDASPDPDDEVTYRLAVTLTNEDKGYRFSEWAEDVPDWWLNDDGRPDMGRVYRELQAEYGRCTGSVYVDRAEGGPPIRVGWHFLSRQRYEDTREPYLRGAWVSVVAERPAVRSYVSVGAVRL